MSAAIFYQTWSSQLNAWQDLKIPVIPSIATFRYHDKKTPVYVIEVSDEIRNWRDYPEFLNFKVIKADYHLKDVKRVDNSCPQMLSKPKDIYNHSLDVPEQTIVYVDSDYFFLQRPDLHHSGVPVIGSNTGYWKYTKNTDAEKTFQLWKSTCANVLIDDQLRAAVKKSQPNARHQIQDETVLGYLRPLYPWMAVYPPRRDNVLFNSLSEPQQKTSDVRGLHVLNAGFKVAEGNRGLVCLYLKELRRMVKSVLGDRMKDVFGEDNILTITAFTIHDKTQMEVLNYGAKLKYLL